jgi:hypothetical protein
MGYLTLASGIASSPKATISTWFRLPSGSVAAAIAQYAQSQAAADQENHWFGLPMPGFIPVCSWGPVATFVSEYGSGKEFPSVLGISCRDGVDAPSLYCRLQYQTGSKLPDAARPNGGSIPDYFEMGDTLGDGGSYAFYQVPGVSRIPVVPDQWNHVLISFDLSAGCSNTISPWIGGELVTDLSINSACRFYWALNDVNYNGAHIGPSSPGACAGFGGVSGDTDPNAVWSNWCNFFGDPSGLPVNPSTFSAGNLPMTPFNFPGHPELTEYNYHIINGPTQVFIGDVVDTSDYVVRRLFIDDNGEPTDPSVAADYFGRNPEIHFNTATDWKTGTNVGTAGDFTPVGTILKTGPNPKLGA